MALFMTVTFVCSVLTSFLWQTDAATAAASNGHAKSKDVNVTFSPEQLQGLLTDHRSLVSMNVTGKFFEDSYIRIFSDNPEVARVVDTSFPVPGGCAEYCAFPVSFEVAGVRLGRAKLTVVVTYPKTNARRSVGSEIVDPATEDQIRRLDTLRKRNNESIKPELQEVVYDGYAVTVWRPRGVTVQIYLLVTATSLVILTFGFGCQLDLEILVSIIRKPIPPLIGFLCQFVVLPLIGFGLSMSFSLRPEFGFGVLTYSCSPGGGMSNVFSLMLGGDLTLSLVMTFLSTLLALGMMPLWMALLSSFYVDRSNVVIPYVEIVKALALMAVPCVLGILLRKFKPSWGIMVHRINRYLAVIFVIFQTLATAAINSYMFGILMTYPIILAAVGLLPICGLLAGYLIAFVCKQSTARCITIALETGIQNIGIGLIMLFYAFRQPEGDMGAVVPLAAGYITVLPLSVVLLVYVIYRQVKKKTVFDRNARESDAANYQPAPQKDVVSPPTSKV